MPKYSKKHKVSEKTEDDALKIARATQRPGQTKEQTKLISQGIQKGIEQYKKQHKAKSRELDKKLNKAKESRSVSESHTDHAVEPESVKSNMLPWVILTLSWIGFLVYIFIAELELL